MEGGKLQYAFWLVGGDFVEFGRHQWCVFQGVLLKETKTIETTSFSRSTVLFCHKTRLPDANMMGVGLNI